MLSLVAAGLAGWAISGRLAPRPFPADGAGAVHPGRSLAFRFESALPADLGVSLTDVSGAALPVLIRREPGDRVVTVEPESPLAWSTRYRLCTTTTGASLSLTPRQSCSVFTTMDRPAAMGPADAPILVAEGADRPFSHVYRAILETEGLNGYATAPLESMAERDLAQRSVVILDSGSLPERLTAPLARWIDGGGLLIAMRPGARLRQSLGLPAELRTRRGALLRAAATSPLSSGIAPAPLQIHGPVDVVQKPEEAPEVLATAEEGGQPLVTLQPRGEGHVLAFGFDLALSTVLTRQGNPLWIDEDRDGSEPRRPNDLFYPDFVDLGHASVPAADEVQRLLVNAIAETAPLPLPRLWYLPDRRRAVIVMAGDDHATEGGTLRVFRRLDSLSPENCDLASWECLRAGSYLTLPTPVTQDELQPLVAKGFEVGVHVDSGCERWITRAELRRVMHDQITDFREKYPALPAQQTHRIHCLSWSGWVDVPEIERAEGIRLDLNYYNWPPGWIAGRQVFLTGSGMPMPYIDLNGGTTEVYQVPSHLVNEDGVPHPEGIAQMLDRALGPEQYFGAFGTHYDYTDGFSRQLTDQALARGVALISPQQMLDWLDGRNASRFSDISWSGSTLRFTLSLEAGAEHASALLPDLFKGQELEEVTCGGERMELVTETIKGLGMDFFAARDGTCEARYRPLATGGTLSGPSAL